MADAAVDPVTGGVVLTGSSANAPGVSVVQTIALDASGHTRWIACGGADDPAWGDDVEVDRSGNVYVAGSRYNGSNWDLVTLAYATDGTLLWRARFDAGDDESATSFRRGLQIDSAGQVYVASDFHLVAYDAAGHERWVMDRQVTSIALDPAENLVITAPTAGTELVDDQGHRLWRNAYGSIEMSLGASGDIFLAGIYVKGTSSSDWDFEVTRLRADGTLAWTRRSDNGAQDRPADLAVDAGENVYVTGESCSRYGLFGVFRADYYTVKYDLDGSQVWSARVKDLDAGASAIAVGEGGRVTVTGVVGTTVQYRQVTQAPPPCPWFMPWCCGR